MLWAIRPGIVCLVTVGRLRRGLLMLVLKRKAGETILIGEDIEVRVLAIEGEQVRVGIAAPQSVMVLRGELVDEIRTETRSSGTPQLPDIQGLSSRLKARSSPPQKQPPH